MLETDHTGQPIRLDAVDDDWLLELLEDKEALSRQAERAKLRIAGQWCLTHPATAETGAATWADAALPGLRECDEPLGGQGTPAVAAFAAEPFAAALRISTFAGMQLLADALDLTHRLPRTWARVQALEVAPWKARKVAQATRVLSREAAAYVDDRLAGRLDSCGARAIGSVVAAAIARFHPDLLDQREKRGRAGWHVRLQHPAAAEFGGTSFLDVAGDSLDLAAFHDLVLAEAAALAAAGDPDPLEVRKARALGVIAAKQAQQGLVDTIPEPPPADPDPTDPDPTDPATTADPADPRPRAPRPTRTPQTGSTRTVFYLHASLADLLDLGDHDDGLAVGEVEGLGPATLARIKEWVGRTDVTIRPVLDLARTDTVDAHDPPEWMREQVILRDRHCVFPWCGRDARACDLDHIDPYDPHGPPGQTRPDNLAPLCRRHHRCKTSGRWRYRRQPDGTYLWQAPQGRAYAVTRNGTLPLTTS